MRGQGTQDSGKCVLLVDDEPLILKILSIKLKACGYKVVTAGTGASALEMLAAAEPDIMLLDVVMPGMSGLEVLARLRRTSDLPVIVSSANVANHTSAMQAGANAFMPKPFDLEKLVATIGRLLDVPGGAPAD